MVHVWLSGAYLRLAELRRKDEPDLAVKFSKMAKDIIGRDQRLVLRKRQFKKLISKF